MCDFNPEDRGSMSVLNFGVQQDECSSQQSRRPQPEITVVKASDNIYIFSRKPRRKESGIQYGNETRAPKGRKFHHQLSSTTFHEGVN